MEEAGLLVTLVFALGAAVGGAVLAARLGQSVILGYILAGVVIGPSTPGFVGDPTAVKALADIGIILLMFTIGVHLSVRDLARAGTVALVGGVAQVLVTLVIGYAVGIALAWPFAQALFFGAVIAISSSAVLSKIIEEHGDGDSAHGRIALAWSTVQDLATIALVVILSAIAGTGAGSNLLPDLLVGAGKAGLFLAVLIPLGLVVLPRLFEHVAALQSREVFVLLVAAVALGIAYASSFFGVSLALGAFMAGLVVGESDLSHQILGAILPLRDIFAALFFVSVGMLVDPAFVAQHWPLVLLTVALLAQAWPSVTALVGDAANPVLLERMHLAQARLLVAAIPDALAVRAVVAHARRVNPTLDIVVRTHSQTEHELLARYGVTESVLGELELAREMTRYALQHLHGDASKAPEVGGGLRGPRMGRGELRPLIIGGMAGTLLLVWAHR